MAVTTQANQSGGSSGGGRSLLVGTNVALATVLVVAIVGVCQWLTYGSSVRADMTSSRINSVSEATERLCRGLDTDVRLTSLYFETDLEDEDQSRYRGAVADLLDLYASTNRGRITTEWINPLSDHEKLKALKERLAGLTLFADQIKTYRQHVEKYNAEMDARLTALVRDELDTIASSAGPLGGQGDAQALAPVENLLTQWTSELDAARDRIEALSMPDNPQYGAAVGELRNLYRDFKKSLEDIVRFAEGEVARHPNLPQAQAAFLREASSRYAETIAALEKESTELLSLKPLKIDDILRQLTPNGNALLVETADDVRVVDFGSIWEPLDPNAGGRQARFKDRAFKGEERLTSAILRATHKKQTAVVFVRYGGPPLFFGIPGQQPALLAAMKRQMEDANFVVEEWDLKTQNTPPTIDPPPTKTVYVVLKPTPPQRGPMGQPSQEPPFSESHKEMVLDAIGENARVLFIAGWYPGPFGPIPSTYEYNEYLKNVWGIKVDSSALLIRTVSTAPGKYGVDGQFYMLNEFVMGDHDIVHGPQARLLGLPWCTPLEAIDPRPDGVELFTLVTQPQRDGIWGVKNIQAYEKQAKNQGYLSRVEGDLEGPFTLAMAAQNGDAKVVVISSRDFALDQVAFASAMSLGPQGIVVRSRNPGNVTLLINSLHWLSDNTEFMNIGKPIDSAVLEIENPSTVRVVQVLTMFAWPALALVFGGVTWWIRRR